MSWIHNIQKKDAPQSACFEQIDNTSTQQQIDNTGTQQILWYYEHWHPFSDQINLPRQ